jgi:hyperosmotically inducible protein
MKTRSRFLLAFALTALLVPRAAAAQISDRDLGEQVIDKVVTYANFSIFDDVSVSVDNRNVTLVGSVTTPLKKDEIAKRVAKVDGIRTLTNNIQVLPVSMLDDDLRMRIARAIYNNNAFWKYANMAQPPIHIVIENGHVTLTGVVNNETERTLAYALAQVPGTFSVKNDLKLDRK